MHLYMSRGFLTYLHVMTSSRSPFLGAYFSGKRRREFRGRVLVLAGCLWARIVGGFWFEVVVLGWWLCMEGVWVGVCVCGEVGGQRVVVMELGELGEINLTPHILQFVAG